MKVFVVNLKTSVQRKKIMEDQLQKLGIPYEIFEAVRGADLTEAAIAAYYEPGYYKKRPAYLTPGMAGCTISHYLLYKKIAAENIDVALILEDDMILDKNFAATISRLESSIKKDEAILLFYQSYEKIRLAKNTAVHVNDKHRLYQLISTASLRSTAGYMIRYETAKALANKLLPFSTFPDDWEKFYERGMLNGIRLVYPSMLTNSYEPTTISPYSIKNSWLAKAKTFAEHNRIFPFNQLLKWRRKRYTEKTRQCVITNEMPVDLRS